MHPDALASAWDLRNLDHWIRTHNRRELCLKVNADDEHVAAAVMFEHASRQREEGNLVLVYSNRLQRPRLADCLAEFVEALSGAPGATGGTLQSLVREFRVALRATGDKCTIYIERADLFQELEGRDASCWLLPLPDNVMLVYSSISVPSSATSVPLTEPDREDAEAFVIRQADMHGKSLSAGLVEVVVTRELRFRINFNFGLPETPGPGAGRAAVRADFRVRKPSVGRTRDFSTARLGQS